MLLFDILKGTFAIYDFCNAFPSVGLQPTGPTYYFIGGWGWLTGAERMPPPGIQAQRPRTRTSRAIRQINGAIVVGG